jgi:type III secretion system inner membrane ring protein
MKRLATLSLLPAVLLLAACHEQQLLRNLSEQQANEVVAVLQAHDLSVQKEDLGKQGFAVGVGQTDFPAAVDLLQKYNLPAQGRIEIAQSFPADALVASPQAEQARLLSAVEQRLEQNLAAMDNVVSARVQVSYPLQASMSGKAEPAMHAAVLITYRNQVNHDVLVSEVKRFIKNSFANVEYDNISVILYQAPSVFRSLATEPAASGRMTWLYWLLAVPAGIAAAAAGLLIYLRRRRQAAAAATGRQATDSSSEPAGDREADTNGTTARAPGAGAGESASPERGTA